MTGSGLPFVGRIIVSTEALDGLEDQADRVGASGLELPENLILHEIGHVLGIGTLWDDLIGGSTSEDPHFKGALAIAAFDAAGGDGYTDGAKVPVEKLVVTAGAGRVRTARASVYRFGDDIMRGPVVVVEADGTVVRVIPGR